LALKAGSVSSRNFWGLRCPKKQDKTSTLLVVLAKNIDKSFPRFTHIGETGNKTALLVAMTQL
jgi:hypothetical protein